MSDDKMVCLNEVCQVYAREHPTVFQEDFKHCPYCGALMVTFFYGMKILNKSSDALEVENE